MCDAASEECFCPCRWYRLEVCLQVCATCGNSWANRNTADTLGTPKQTAIRLCLTSADVASTASSLGLLKLAQESLLTTWSWLEWRNQTVAVIPVITGEFTALSTHDLLNAKNTRCLPYRRCVVLKSVCTKTKECFEECLQIQIEDHCEKIFK